MLKGTFIDINSHDWHKTHRQKEKPGIIPISQMRRLKYFKRHVTFRKSQPRGQVSSFLVWGSSTALADQHVAQEKFYLYFNLSSFFQNLKFVLQFTNILNDTQRRTMSIMDSEPFLEKLFPTLHFLVRNSKYRRQNMAHCRVVKFLF